MKSFITLLLISSMYLSCTNKMRTNTNTDPQADVVLTYPDTLDYSNEAISKETVKFSIDNQDLIDVIYNRVRSEHIAIDNTVTASLSIDISDLSIYEDVVSVSCPSFDVEINLINIAHDPYVEADGIDLYEGVIVPADGSQNIELDCLDANENHYTVTFYDSDAANTATNLALDTKIIFTEDKISGVLGFRRANDSVVSENDYLFF